MSTDPRASIPSLQVGELRTHGMVSAFAPDGARTLRIERVEVRDVKLQAPLGALSATSVALSNVTVRLRAEPQPERGALSRIDHATVGELRLQGARIENTRVPPRAAARSQKSWRLEPLDALDGTLHADIADAAWIFDADVTIPIAQGRVDFNRATVEHVGPDSSMGISRMGVYVDAPNGRTYLYLLSATRIPGATFERRGGLLSSRVSDRGAIDLRPFAECFVTGMPLGAPAKRALEMIARTRLRAQLRLGDGVVGVERSRIVLAGRENGKNQVELSSARSGSGLILSMLDLSAAEAHLEAPGLTVSTGALSAALSVQLNDLVAVLTFGLNIPELTLRDIALQ